MTILTNCTSIVLVLDHCLAQNQLHEQNGCSLNCNFDTIAVRMYSNCNCMESFAIIGSLPNNGLSEVTGIVSDTVFKNTVSDRRMVTPENVKLDDKNKTA